MIAPGMGQLAAKLEDKECFSNLQQRFPVLIEFVWDLMMMQTFHLDLSVKPF